MKTITPAFKRPLPRGARLLSPSLIALFVPGILFVIGLRIVCHYPGFAWLSDVSEFPWEFFVIAIGGSAATVGGVLDWIYHRSGRTVIGGAEHRSELAALAGGGGPLFLLMAGASVSQRPQMWLLPILIVVLYTTVMICYDEFVFHRRRCGRYETGLHRLLVFGNAIAWLAWMHWCFVRGGSHA